jgi:hypothetical protein
MIDVREVIENLARAASIENFPDANTLVGALGLDTRGAAIANTKRGDLIISNAALDSSALKVGVVATLAPIRKLMLLFDDPRPSYKNIEGMAFGANQRLQQSRLSSGFAVLFQANHFDFAITASAPDGVLETISCVPN